ncbi:peptidoglycan DD-metalloendopeptidase family protein [Gracilibacillus alcaliphilus]|uniref:peptidoglycan DD-metalloendopeptidase family protein n=1 Tax=Gracilibacillus alcaliphilus TaxID=1401441 RepID=UPI00195CA669|nr:peptidoglycan DD-metalloendopeptidase family protein [Gracilibacillus alcaliphilus]MBM7678694.1 murein DD-endopeptidase MepM/ murein hydrolase activator NlpD [Gracilibacillus alcaliphilus]
MQARLGKFVKGLTVTAIVAAGLSAQAVFADELKLKEVYHVYVDDKHLGVIQDKETVEAYIDNKIAEQEEQHSYTYSFAEDVDYITETVFTPEVDQQAVLDQLDKELTLQAEATALTINNQTIGYFANQEEAEEVLQRYKEQYVDKDILKKIDNSSADAEPLSKGESAIIDVSLTEKVSTSEKKVPDKEILTVEEGLSLLKKGALEEKTHVVKDGEVLGAIADQYDLSTDKLLSLNPDLDEDSVIKAGDELQVTVYEPYVEVKVIEAELKEEKLDFKTKTKESDKLYKGEEEVKQEGKQGKIEKTYQTTTINGKETNQEVTDKQVIKKPTDKVIIKGTKVVSAQGTGDLAWPAVGGTITSHMGERWGKQHKGIDIAGVSDRSILAADNGTVISAGWNDGGYGNKIVIEHNNGYRTIYAHMESINVSPGQVVEQGQKIGVMGSTGDSTGVHLHFEVYKNGSLVNPAEIL